MVRNRRGPRRPGAERQNSARRRRQSREGIQPVAISPPAVLRFATEEELEDNNNEKDNGSDSYSLLRSASQAEAKAFLFRSGVNKGRIECIQLTDPGSGYRSNEIIRVRVDLPETPHEAGGVRATATAVLEYEVRAIQMVKNGTGYAVERPIQVRVDPPPLTARVNMNDPLVARIVSTDDPLPATTVPSREMLKRMPDIGDPASVASRVSKEAGREGGGGCVGRACYDRPVVAVAYARAAEKDSYSAYRSEDADLKQQSIETALGLRSAVTAAARGGGNGGSVAGESFRPPSRVVSGSSIGGGQEGTLASKLLPFLGSGPSSSSQLLSLLPAGIGLEFDTELGRYRLAVDPEYDDTLQGLELDEEVASTGALSSSSMSLPAINPEFGPRGRSPIEREMELGAATYLRFVASGAICSSGVHLALTPIDVVKTKVQTDPARYPGIVPSFRRVWNEEGFAAFFTGWAPTFLGFFVWGGFSYGFTEFLRRSFSALPLLEAPNLEVPIILPASGLASFFGSFVICPFEAVRIRSVAQPDFGGSGGSIAAVVSRMIREEGILSLFSAVPVFLVKEIPFAMAKFTVFDVSTAWMYERFPTAREDIQLSLLISLAGGTMGGIVAAVVSNPADATISEMKKAKSDMGPAQAVEIVLDRGGPPALFTGLPLRMIFYSLVVSLQFLVYDAVRFALGIGVDDLKLYLDVLGGALRESGGPV